MTGLPGPPIMQITLLPPLLPTEAAVPVRTAEMAFAPGMKIVATVLSTRVGEGTVLMFGGRRLPTDTPLPHPPGTTLRFEVVAGGPHPRLQLVGVSAHATPDVPDAPVPGMTGPAVSAAGYGLARAVVAARSGGDVAAAAATLASWIPQLVARGVIGAAEGERLRLALSPLVVPPGAGGPAEGAEAGAVLARALAARLADGGLFLERKLADRFRGGDGNPGRLLARDLRARLAVLADAIAHAPPETGAAGDAVRSLQQAMLADQARSVAHLVRDGVVDARVPLETANAPVVDVLMRLRVGRDSPDADGDADPAPWRQVTLDLALEGLGHVHVRLGVTAAQVRAEFVVEAADVADTIEGRLADLTQSLAAAGFEHVLSRVAIDPVRANAPDDTPALAPHSIVDVRA